MSVGNADWRLEFGKDPAFYRPYTWTLKRWSQTRPGWDHDHCEFCMAKISDLEGTEIQSEGWTDEEETYWFCTTCFEDFKDMYQWKCR